MATLTVDLSGTDHVPAGDAIRTAAATVVTRVEDLQTTVQDLRDDWAGLPAIYSDTLHDDELYAAFGDPVTDVEDVVSMAEGLQTAADTCADAFDAIRTARDTIRTVDLPAAQAAYEQDIRYVTDPALWPIYQDLHEKPLQDAADQLVTDLTTAEDDFATAVAAAMALRPGRSVTANFTYGTHDPLVIEAQELHAAAFAPDATAEDLAAYYEHLAALTPEQIEALGAVDPSLRTTPPPLPTTEEELAAWPGGAEGAAWWKGLSPEQQAALVLAMPALVGNTEGVPYTDRNEANLSVLDLAENDPDLSAAQLEDLEGLRDALNGVPAGAGEDAVRMLLALRVDAEPVLAATSIGNPDTAETTTFSVPGMGAETSGAAGMMSEAQNLYDATSGNRAVITWIGYDTPDGAQNTETLGSSQVLYNDAAYAGGINLAYALDGYQESREHNGYYAEEILGVPAGEYSADPTVNVIAHSYGTPTSAYALTMTEHEVDTFVMYGSVGVDGDRIPTADALNVAHDANGEINVYATNAGEDWVAVPLGQGGSILGSDDDRFRTSPTDDTFGAKAFSSDGDGTSPGEATNGHGAIMGPNGAEGGYGYMETGSQSLNSIANIVDGDGDEVPQIEQSPWDDRRETLEDVVMFPDRVYHTVDAGIDISQDVMRESVDGAQQDTNAVIDAVQDAHPFSNPVSNLVIDGGQWLANGVVDAGQTVVDGTLDGVQDGAERVHDGLEATGGWLLDRGQDFADWLKPNGIW